MKLKTKNNRWKRQRRNNHGAGIVLSTLVTMIVTALIIGGAIFLVSIGTSLYYQARFNNVARAAAKYAVNCNYWLGAERPNVDLAATQTQTQNVALIMLAQMNVPANQATVTVDQTDPNGCAVTIDITGLAMQQGITFGNTSVRAYGFEPWLDQRPNGVYSVTFTANGLYGARSYLLPTYGAGANTPRPSASPSGSQLVPYWENGGDNGMNPQVIGPYQNVPPQTFSSY